jgi:hypothetical protein
MDDFFISRAGEDKAWGTWIAQVLTKAGYGVRIQDWHFSAAADFIDLSAAGVNECARTIGVISPDYWKNLYTRREHNLAMELGRRGQQDRFIPILVRPTQITSLSATTIYIDLTPLRDEQAALKELLERVEQAYGQPQGTPDRKERPPARFPLAACSLVEEQLEILVHLCDRDDQEDALRDAFEKWKRRDRPLVCIIYGEEDHMGEKFVERLPAAPLPECLGRGHDAIEVHTEEFVWPNVTRRTSAEGFVEDLDEEIIRLGLDEFGDDRPTIVRTDFLAAEWCRNTAKVAALIESFVDRWQDYKVAPPRPFLVCLTIRFRRTSPNGRDEPEATLEKNNLLEALQKLRAQQYADTCVILPPLREVHRERAQRWTRLPEIKRLRKIEYETINDIYTRCNPGFDELVMSRLAPELRKLLY